MVTDAKYLGVYLDQKLTWRVHIDKLSKKLASSTAVLKRISTYIPSDCRKSLYHTLFESHTNYGISVWGNTCKRNIDTIFRLQKKCIRILFGDRDQFLDKYCTAAQTTMNKFWTINFTQGSTPNLFSIAKVYWQYTTFISILDV